ncbi:MAG: nucleotide exchange factor GrpE [Odoribacteraceae bacterium]|jgi:molecular chaperone GrpE|nr:nucleotide exchange factor GrpE [Odoribacteraceae bacterium]
MSEDNNEILREEEIPENTGDACTPEGEHVKNEPVEGKKKRWGRKEDKQLEEMGMKLAEMNDKYLRLSAEFDNYRKRTLKERMELLKTAGEQVLVGILPVVDNLERALSSMENASDVTALKEGVNLIYSNFKEFLTRNGVKEIETLDADFNTDLHEAVTTIPTPTPALKGKVIDTIERGYTLNEKVIRFAKVIVGE